MLGVFAFQRFSTPFLQVSRNYFSLLKEHFADGALVGNQGIIEMSHGNAVILLLVYISFLTFQLKSRIQLYNAPSPKAEKRRRYKKDEEATTPDVTASGAMDGGQ